MSREIVRLEDLDPDDIRNCGNCKYARFVYTPTGRFKKDCPGHCLWPIPELPVVPLCYQLTLRNVSRIWPKDDHCPCWVMKKEGDDRED